MIELIQAAEVRNLVQDILVLLLVFVAICWGRWPERLAIATWIFCFEIPTLIYREFLGFEVLLTGVDPYMAGKDIAAAAAWITLALFANRNYTLWVAGVQLLAFGAHVAQAMIEAISPIGFTVLVVAPGWLQLIILAVGFTRHILRKRKYGAYRDWRISRAPISFEAFKDAGQSSGSANSKGFATKERQ